MNLLRKKKLGLLVLVLGILSLAAGLILYALRQNINLFYSPTQVVRGEAQGKNVIRLGGMVVKKSIHRNTQTLQVDFQLTDYRHIVNVSYQGILPDLFKEGQGIVALGRMVDNQHFKAIEVLAKHDENYMPPEITSTLKQTRPV